MPHACLVSSACRGQARAHHTMPTPCQQLTPKARECYRGQAGGGEFQRASLNPLVWGLETLHHAGPLPVSLGINTTELSYTPLGSRHYGAAAWEETHETSLPNSGACTGATAPHQPETRGILAPFQAQPCWHLADREAQSNPWDHNLLS